MNKKEQIDQIIREEIISFRKNFIIKEATNIGGVSYIIGIYKNTIVFTPKNIKDFEEFSKDSSKFVSALTDKLNKIAKGVKFDLDNTYRGAGVAFEFDKSHFIKNLK